MERFLWNEPLVAKVVHDTRRGIPCEDNMRPAIRKSLVSHFTAELERTLPQFHRTQAQKHEPPIWACQSVSTLVTFFILLQPHTRADRFSLELAWSENGEFPWEQIGRVNLGEPSGRERYPCWETNKEETWDLAPEATAAIKAQLDALSRGQYVPHADIDPPVEQVLPNIEPAVADAVKKLAERGLPFFRKVADHRGIVLPE